MGNAVRMMNYDRAANEANAIPALNFLQQQPLMWHRLDDGVMGGQSVTLHHVKTMGEATKGEEGMGTMTDATTSTNTLQQQQQQQQQQQKQSSFYSMLHFTGTINTIGGGFTSIRAPIPLGLPPTLKGIDITYRGDGKTYKVILTSRGGGGPFATKPSWQINLPTQKRQRRLEGMDENDENDMDNDEWEHATLYLDKFVPSFASRMNPLLSEEERSKYQLVPEEMIELGLMLSLKLSDGSPNPKETFGEGVFPFSLWVKEVKAIFANDDATSSTGNDVDAMEVDS